MDIIQSSSLDVPYDNTIYRATIKIHGAPFNDETRIVCTKVMTKKYEDRTYFKVDLPAEMNISSEQDIDLIIYRDDGYHATIKTKIRNNIVAVETNNLSWYKLTSVTPTLKQDDVLEAFLRAQTAKPNLYERTTTTVNPIWIPNNTTSDSTRITYSTKTTGTTYTNE
ncbi:MAG TPA: hypothetical protein VI911_09925 [Patescibacteria group bacterium]|nr:hypothetical protein [Patescibacteria group bacterium]